MDATLHIASLLLHCRAELLPAIKANLLRLPGVELHQESASGKLVVVLEAEHESRILEVIQQVQELPGVLNAALIYHEELLEGDA